jgi:cation diffusion facilitator family transporter
MTPRFGRTELPEEAREALRRAKRLEWVTIGYLAVTIVAVFLVMGNSQAMRTAWAEDLLSLAPPIAFLVAVRLVSKPPTEKYPYGLHRSVGVGHLVAALALLSMGGFLVVDAASGLVTAEHPPIGTMTLLGVTFWAGWAMVAVMALTIPLPIVFGRKKMELAEQLHDKVLYADADMNKADWMTAAGSIVGVLGIGIGWWWADSAAALFISGSILWDGVKNLRAAITDLIDHRARTYDGEETHPVVGRLEELLRGLPWVAEAGARVRDEGHVFHAEAFVVPRGGRTPSLTKLVAAREACEELDWKLHDVTVVLVDELPEEARASAGSARGRGR